MMFSTKDLQDRTTALVSAIHQARDAAMATNKWAYIHDCGGNKFLVNAQPLFNMIEPVCAVRPDLDVFWMEERGKKK